ncbi:unnamed protein product, partial [Mesorhabditis belari]|uniref:Uncharacterized protein n=1 Tax=Mesorhabditis belari TaxID=2138241 RepID=A0AAF3EJL2_9BILA
MNFSQIVIFFALVAVCLAISCKTNVDDNGEIQMDFDDTDCNNGCEYCGRMKQSGRFYTFEAYGCGCGDDSIFGPDDDNERMLDDCTDIFSQNTTTNGFNLRQVCCQKELCA